MARRIGLDIVLELALAQISYHREDFQTNPNN
jgi:hypothetical protein